MARRRECRGLGASVSAALSTVDKRSGGFEATARASAKRATVARSAGVPWPWRERQRGLVHGGQNVGGFEATARASAKRATVARWAGVKWIRDVRLKMPTTLKLDRIYERLGQLDWPARMSLSSTSSPCRSTSAIAVNVGLWLEVVR